MDEKFPPLEIACENCKGSGKDPDDTPNKYGWRKDCVDCGGDGHRISEFGEVVLDFIRKYYKISLKVGGRQ